MRLDKRRRVRVEIDHHGREQRLPLDRAALALALELLVDDALMRRVLVDDDDAVGGLGDDVIHFHLRPRRAERCHEVALVRRRGRGRRRGRELGERRLRRLGEPRRRGRSPPVPAGLRVEIRGGGAWRGSSPSRRWTRLDAGPRSGAA